MKLAKQWGWICLCVLLLIAPAPDLSAGQKPHVKNTTYHSSSVSKKKNSSKKNHTKKKSSKKHTTKHSHRTPFVDQNNYQNFWHRSTFPTNQASIDYHTKKHGNGRSSLQYTRDAVNFYAKNKHLRQPFTLKDGSQGYKIKKGSEGGTWTKEGEIVTFWG